MLIRLVVIQISVVPVVTEAAVPVNAGGEADDDSRAPENDMSTIRNEHQTATRHLQSLAVLICCGDDDGDD